MGHALTERGLLLGATVKCPIDLKTRLRFLERAVWEPACEGEHSAVVGRSRV
jgi:hypothetical protein